MSRKEEREGETLKTKARVHFSSEHMVPRGRRDVTPKRSGLGPQGPPDRPEAASCTDVRNPGEQSNVFYFIKTD